MARVTIAPSQFVSLSDHFARNGPLALRVGSVVRQLSGPLSRSRMTGSRHWDRMTVLHEKE
ncbi:hypothetical protein SPHV1_100012 [Novosphingobium sp. KN65.2]|nr:hypothetical protein SPHV1_100012 [Novosphingobium sp. KN65.2]